MTDIYKMEEHDEGHLLMCEREELVEYIMELREKLLRKEMVELNIGPPWVYGAGPRRFKKLEICECITHGKVTCLHDMDCKICGTCLNWKGYEYGDDTCCAGECVPEANCACCKIRN